MKTYEYRWGPEIYLLHLQFTSGDHDGYRALVCRQFGDRHPCCEEIVCVRNVHSHRVLISRSHPRETAIVIDYPDPVMLEVFELDDRAYYPTGSIFRG